MSEQHQVFEIDNQLYVIDNNDGSIYAIDFDKDKDSEIPNKDNIIQEDKEQDTQDPVIKVTESERVDVSDPNFEKIMNHAIKNIKKGENDMDFDKENHETSEHKPDGSETAKEKRITDCVEKTGKDRKTCTEEVIKKMHKEGAEVTNPEDMKEELEVEKEDIKEEVIEKDTIEVCQKEYDFLKKQAEELKQMKADKEKVESTLESFKADFLKFKGKIDAKDEAEKEVKRQEVIKRISHDFDIPEEELKEDSKEELEKLESRLELALRRDTEEEEEDTFGTEEDFKKIGDNIQNRYFLPV